MTYWENDSWRDSYDAWKLASPYDDDTEGECDHEEYEIGWEGRAECHACGATWWASLGQIRRYDEANRRAAAAFERQEHPIRSRIEAVRDWLRRTEERWAHVDAAHQHHFDMQEIPF